MAGWVYPGQVFDHVLTPLKGWPSPTALDFDANISTNVNIGSVGTPPNSGQCVHYTANGFEMGANLTMMGMFLWPGGADFDVANQGVPAGIGLGGTTTYVPAWVPVRPTGKLNALVCKGSYEFETTEYDTNQTYAVNDLLRAVTSNTDSNAGKLTNQDASGGVGFGTTSKCAWGDPTLTNWESVVGVVSRGTYTNANGISALAFWPVYLPGTR